MRRWVLQLALAAAAACGDDGKPHAPQDAGAEAGSRSDGASAHGQDASQDASEDAAADDLPATPERFLPAIVSGSRLKARVLAPAGGEPVFLEWWDAQLSLACDFAYATDGKYRCLPKQPGNSPIGHISASCDDAPIVINFRPDCAEATHIQQSVEIEPACPHQGSASEVWALASIPAPEAYYDGSPSFCDGPREPPESGTFAETTTRVDPASFVAGTLRVIADGDQLGVEVLESEDGARLLTDAVDPRYGRCGQAPLLDEATCGPRRGAFASRDLFADEGCAEPVVPMTRDDECEGPIRVARIIHEPTDTTPRLITFGSIGEELSTTVYRKDGETCTEVPVSEALSGSVERLHRIGPVSLYPVQAGLHGDGALKTLFLSREDGVLLRPGVYTRTGGSEQMAYFEDETGKRCVPIRAPDGTYKCMPVGGVAIVPSISYSDSTCTQRVGTFYPGSEAPTSTPSVLFERDSEACASAGIASSIHDVFELGAPHNGPLYASDGADCYEWGEGEGYLLGRSILSELPALEHSTL